MDANRPGPINPSESALRPPRLGAIAEADQSIGQVYPTG